MRTRASLLTSVRGPDLDGAFTDMEPSQDHTLVEMSEPWPVRGVDTRLPIKITNECMDCGRRYVGPRAATAPSEVWLHVVHCGCKPPSAEPSFYIDTDGERIEEDCIEEDPKFSTGSARRFRSRKFAVDWEARESWLVPFRVLAACRVLRFPLKLRRLQSLNFMSSYFLPKRPKNKTDTFFFLTHRYYLSKAFNLAQRIDCAVAHYSFEARNYGPIYHGSVYQSPRGLVLWHRFVDGTRYTITLCATEDNRYEGDLSVLCFVNETRVCRVSFSYVSGSLFGLQAEHTMFVTRSQTDRNPELERFRDSFKQNFPPYFCVASVCGIAMANGMPAILMVKDEAQIGYEKRYAEGFRNSYSALWKAFGAQEMVDRCAYIMNIPPKLTPLSSVAHKNRARARRQNWLEVALSARRVVLQDRTSWTPPPIDGEALAHCLHAGYSLN
jgi:uncharacterized protein VirK/YbjX